MKIQLTTLGHSCVLVEDAERPEAKLLLDPGSLTPALSPIADLGAVLVTHAHADHIDPEQIRRLREHVPVPVYGDAATVSLLQDAGVDDLHELPTGASEIAGLPVSVSEWSHETIYPGVPLPTDLGLLLAGRVFAPGDAFAVPEFPVEVLLLPTGAPWMKLSEAIDYLREVSPRLAVPVHDGGLAAPHREMHRTLMQKFAPTGTTVLRPQLGERIDLDAV